MPGLMGRLRADMRARAPDEGGQGERARQCCISRRTGPLLGFASVCVCVNLCVTHPQAEESKKHAACSRWSRSRENGSVNAFLLERKMFLDGAAAPEHAHGALRRLSGADASNHSRSSKICCYLRLHLRWRDTLGDMRSGCPSASRRGD